MARGRKRLAARVAGAAGAVVVLAIAGGCDEAEPNAPPRASQVVAGEVRPGESLAAAFERLRPGDRLVVRGGTYRERITDAQLTPGTEDQPIEVVAADGERPVVEGLLWLRGADHWRLRGINVRWSDENRRDEHMVKILDGVGWSFEDAEVWDAHSYAAVLIGGTTSGEPADWRFARNCVHHTHRSNDRNQDHLLYVNVGLDAGEGTIEDNLLFDAPNGVGIKLGGPSRRDGGAANVLVRRNTIHGAAQAVLVAWSAHDVRIEGNLLTGAAPRYGLVRGYELSGDGNVVAGNAGGGADRFLLNDRGHRGIEDGGENRFPVEPRYDQTDDCSGFRATGEASNYGRR